MLRNSVMYECLLSPRVQTELVARNFHQFLVYLSYTDWSPWSACWSPCQCETRTSNIIASHHNHLDCILIDTHIMMCFCSYLSTCVSDCIGCSYFPIFNAESIPKQFIRQYYHSFPTYSLLPAVISIIVLLLLCEFMLFEEEAVGFQLQKYASFSSKLVSLILPAFIIFCNLSSLLNPCVRILGL